MIVEERAESVKCAPNSEGSQPEFSNRITAIIMAISVGAGIVIVETKYWEEDLDKIRFFLESLGIGK